MYYNFLLQTYFHNHMSYWFALNNFNIIKKFKGFKKE